MTWRRKCWILILDITLFKFDFSSLLSKSLNTLSIKLQQLFCHMMPDADLCEEKLLWICWALFGAFTLRLLFSYTNRLSSPTSLSFTFHCLLQTIRGSTDTPSMGATSKSGSWTETTPTAIGSCYLTAGAKYLSDNHFLLYSTYFARFWCWILPSACCPRSNGACFFLLSCSTHRY